MLKKTIKYTDYNGNEKNEVFYFNFSKPELVEMERAPLFELQDLLNKVQAMDDPDSELTNSERDEIMKRIGALLRTIICKSNGKKSEDGTRFIKRLPNGESVGDQFAETEAYNELYMELIEDGNKLSAFMRGIVPIDYAPAEQKPKIVEENA